MAAPRRGCRGAAAIRAKEKKNAVNARAEPPIRQAGRPGHSHKRSRQNTNRATTWPVRPWVPEVAFMYPKPDCGTPAAFTTCVCKGLLEDGPGTCMRLKTLKNSPRISRVVFSQMREDPAQGSCSPPGCAGRGNRCSKGPQ